MLHDFAILHRRKPRLFTGGSSPVWATCLRTLAFVTPAYQPETGDEFYRGSQAYQFLLEIVCGLHSPILGETEVMGQFKIFAMTWTEREPHRIALIQRVLSDAKALRSRHLSHLGTQSYGSWLRKNLTATRAHVIGAGHLAQEILPYVEKRGEVVLHTRRPVQSHLPVRSLAERGFDHGALIVAAPVSAADVAEWLGASKPTQIFDLRDTSVTDPIAGAVSLDHIFKQIERTRALLIPRLEIIRTEILERGEKLAALEKVRPQGWDDLCA